MRPYKPAVPARKIKLIFNWREAICKSLQCPKISDRYSTGGKQFASHFNAPKDQTNIQLERSNLQVTSVPRKITPITPMFNWREVICKSLQCPVIRIHQRGWTVKHLPRKAGLPGGLAVQTHSPEQAAPRWTAINTKHLQSPARKVCFTCELFSEEFQVIPTVLGD